MSGVSSVRAVVQDNDVYILQDGKLYYTFPKNTNSDLDFSMG
jgi:hypothetical protein